MKHGPAKSVRARVAVAAAAMAEAEAVVVAGEGAETDANIAGKPQPVFRFFFRARTLFRAFFFCYLAGVTFPGDPGPGLAAPKSKAGKSLLQKNSRHGWPPPELKAAGARSWSN